MKDLWAPLAIFSGSILCGWSVYKYLFTDSKKPDASQQGASQQGASQQTASQQKYFKILNASQGEWLTDISCQDSLPLLHSTNDITDEDILIGFRKMENTVICEMVTFNDRYLVFFPTIHPLYSFSDNTFRDNSFPRFLILDFENEEHRAFLKKNWKCYCGEKECLKDEDLDKAHHEANQPIVEMLRKCRDECGNSYKETAYVRAISEVVLCPVEITAFDVCNNIYHSADGIDREWAIGSKMRERIRHFLASHGKN